MTTSEIRAAGPRPPASNGAAWERAWLMAGPPPEDRLRERAERIAAKRSAKMDRERAKLSRAADRSAERAETSAEKRAARVAARAYEHLAVYAAAQALVDAHVIDVEFSTMGEQIASVAARLCRHGYRAAA